MRKLTKADVIKKIREHFTRPGAQLARDPEGGCVYRGEGPLGAHDPHSSIRCAMGVLIPDKLYTIHMEGKLANQLCWGYSSIWDLFKPDEDMVDFLRACQLAHDFAATKDAFLSDLEAVARAYGVEV